MCNNGNGAFPTGEEPELTGHDRGPGPAPDTPAWRERAHDRSLASARRRADDQQGRLLQAAQDLLDAGLDVTVPAVVARAGMSTKTFYRHFGSRDELLLALFEEEFTAGARALRSALADQADPVDRLRVFVGAYLSLPRGYPSREVRRARIQESQRLRAVDPERSAAASAPLSAALRDIVADLAAAGRPGEVEVEMTTRSILHVLNGHLVDLAYADSGSAGELATHALRVCFGIVGLAPERD